VKCVEDGEQLLIFLFGYMPPHWLNSNRMIVSSIGVVEIYPIFDYALITKDPDDDRPRDFQNPICSE
jgi:hypothetical protein